MTKTKLLLLSLAILSILIYITYSYLANPKTVGYVAQEGFSTQTIQTTIEDNTQKAVEVLLTDLDIPWEIAFLPDNSMLITLRSGQLIHVTQENNINSVINVTGVFQVGEGGLLGLALHPDYENNHLIYLYSTTLIEGKVTNRVERYFFNPEINQLSQRTVIIQDIPGATYHDGGRISFGPDGYLYISTGDAGNANTAQDLESLAGKILRLTDSGDIPEDNPFNSPVYSYGHRNAQGLAWADDGTLWSVEHGPSGLQSGEDEVNVIKKGLNYGWPIIKGDTKQEGMMPPIIQSGTKTTWAPADIAVYQDHIFFSGLKGEGLYSAKIVNNKIEDFKKHFDREFGRIRAVVIDPTQKWLYISTSNGKGNSDDHDDKIIRVNIKALESSDNPSY